MKKSILMTGAFLLAGIAFIASLPPVVRSQAPGALKKDSAAENAVRLVSEGRQIFRFDTFGDQAFWGGSLKLHQAIEGSRFGGVGSGVSPKTAITVGLKVDVDALPSHVFQQLQQGGLDLNDPAVTLQLLKLDAVVGVKGF
ncbi:MAG TPA: hypothetical protein VMZ52_18380 [Bryobacteraceae bacterium]|nr:hypothetical protein [Bryobacteraceae bacterium]